MPHHSKFSQYTSSAGRLNQSQRNLVVAFVSILLPTIFGLSILFLQLFDVTTGAGREYALSARRDTLLLSGYRTSMSLFYTLQEAYAHSSRRDELRPVTRSLVADLDSIRRSYVRLLDSAQPRNREVLLARFEAHSANVDFLIAYEGKFQAQTEGSSTEESAPLSADRNDVWIPRPHEFTRKMQEDFESILQAELLENIAQVEQAGSRIKSTTLRTFGISIILLIVGSALAFFVLLRGKLAKEGTPRFSTLLEYSMNPIEVLGNTGKILYVNPAYERWTGKSTRELIGQPAFEGVRLVQGGPGGDFWPLVVDSLKSGKAWSGDVEIVRPDNGISFTLLIISPMMDRSGNLLECIAIHHDLTERRELTRKFEESQEKYQNIVESSLDGIVIVQDGRLVFVNSSAMKIFGYSSTEEMKAVSFSETVAPASRFFVLEGYQKGKLIGEDILRNYELKGLTKLGKMVDLEVNAKLVSWNGRPAVQASFRDITERKTLEREQALWLWEQETMSTIDRQLVSTVDLQKVLENISHHAKILTRADWAGVMLVDLETSIARWRAMKGNEAPLPPESFRLTGIHAELARSKEPLVIQDFGVNPRFPVEELPPFKAERIISAARFPLVVDREIRGQLMIGFRQHHEFSPRELRLLVSLAEKSSIGLANAQLYDSLLSREKELEMLSGARVQAQEDERRRIAREIHDSLGQMLTAIKFNVEILEDSSDLQQHSDKERLEDIKSLLDNSMAEAREISYNLMPSVLVDFGLVPALQNQCEQFSKRTGVKMNFRVTGVDARIDPAMEIGLYRIAQEALNNIAKHAEAAEVNVQLIADEQTLRLMVDDDGKGFTIRTFDPTYEERHGMGLVGMRERAVSFNGTFIINSKPEQGTEIIVEIPLRQRTNGDA
ncbi:MAG: PAS domain S-box protein [Ignavibacteriales bacterium]|nr:PAS domain S-box protein [Ignavibacteriales bacterium]